MIPFVIGFLASSWILSMNEKLKELADAVKQTRQLAETIKASTEAKAAEILADVQAANAALASASPT